MKKIFKLTQHTPTVLIILLSLIFTAIIALFNPIHHAQADVGELPTSGYTITPGTKTDKISMDYEKVDFTIFEEYNTDFLNSPEGKIWVADVKAQFEFSNLTGQDISKDLIFPIPSTYIHEDKPDQATDFKVLVNGQEIPFEISRLDYNLPYQAQNEPYDKLISLLFSANFTKNDVTTITVEYKQKIVYLAKSEYVQLSYILQTGSHWAGNIKSGDIVVEFPSEITESLFKEINDEFEIQNKKLIWHFENFEPTEQSDNVKIIFSPDQLKSWNQNNNNLSKIEANTNQLTVKLEDKNLIPEEYYKDDDQFPFYWLQVQGSTLYLVDNRNPTETDLSSPPGWLAELQSSEKPELTYNFDNKYQIEGVKIFPGVKAHVPDYNSSITDYGTSYETRYDLFNRPKTLKLSFEDGSSKTIELDDTPNEFITKTLTDVESGSVKIEITDTYENATGTNSHLGIGRLQFVLGEKVEDIDEIIEEEGYDTIIFEEPENEPSIIIGILELVKQWTGYFAAGCFLFLLMIFGLVVIIVNRLKNRKKKSSEN